ncbi:tetraketide alpha-pyrone reductase 1 [Punica granatum]|uniref:Tetraketide alpha-pyrone reductase 1 n=2 Tax=Punica granatum TaxID=22663 RepID=A0A6P8CEU3_PUNGR|nr:tetraketide alpha-pyrone reductase 1 [Punica granatum]
MIHLIKPNTSATKGFIGSSFGNKIGTALSFGNANFEQEIRRMGPNEEEVKGRICVTGAAGYLASWLVKRLLSSGYHVIGTVRDPGNEKKVAHLWKLEGAKERLTLVKADLMENGSFDDAIMGCQGVFHTASPVIKPSSDPKAEIVKPAVEGTLNVLRSCKKNPDLRRVVLTSSSSTIRIRDDFDPNVPFDESSWSSTELCEMHQIWYSLSKTLAEKAAWEYCNENKIDLVTVLPAFLIGPSLPPDLCSTASDVLGLLKGETKDFQWHGRMGYIHIDDVALAHILVYEHESAKGRFLASSTVVDNDELVSFLSARYPSLPIPKRFEPLNRPHYDFDTAKLESLGMKFKSIQEMFDDCVASLVEQGYLPSVYL